MTGGSSMHRGALRIVANLGDRAADVPLSAHGRPGDGGPAVVLASRPGVSIESAGLRLPPAALGIVDSIG